MIEDYFYVVIYNVDKKQVFNFMSQIYQWKAEARAFGVKLDIVSIKRINYKEVL